MDNLKELNEMDEILKEVLLGDCSEEFDVLDDLLEDENKDKKEFIKKDLASLIDIFKEEPYYNFLVDEIEEIKELNICIDKYFIGMEILLSIAYYKLYDNLERVIKVYTKALEFKTTMKGEVISIGSLDNFIALMRCDYTDKRALIDRVSYAFSINLNQGYTKKLSDINNKLIDIQQAQIKGEKCDNDIDITQEDFNEILNTIHEVVFRIKNMLKINWKYVVNNLEK